MDENCGTCIFYKLQNKKKKKLYCRNKYSVYYNVLVNELNNCSKRKNKK